MKIRATAIVLSSSLMVLPIFAEGTPDCARLAEALTVIEGYAVTVPPAGPEQGWCVLDGARFRSQAEGRPDLAVDRLRLRLSATEVDLDLQGLRAAPRPSDRTVDDRLRSLMRLQSADLRLRAVHDPVAGVLNLSGLRLDLSSGARLELDAEIRGANLVPASLALGAVTGMKLVWRNDGKVLGPVMDLAGEDLSGAAGSSAVDATRAAFAEVVRALPVSALDDASRKALAAAVGALPQGRGKLTLTFVSEDGIGAARLAVVALSDDALSPKALEALLDGATITAAWQPGLAP
jgi:hypothetical protein